MSEHTPTDYIVTCRTDGCDNEGIEIAMPCYPNPDGEVDVECGPCRTRIVDVHPAGAADMEAPE